MLPAERQKAGRKQEYDWAQVALETYRLMDLHGEFDGKNRSWNAQARIEELLLDFCGNTLGREPSPANLRRKLKGWLDAWRSDRRAAAE